MYLQVPYAQLVLSAVDDAVFRDGLHGQLGQAAVVDPIPVLAVALDGQGKPLGKAVLLNLEIGLAVLQPLHALPKLPVSGGEEDLFLFRAAHVLQGDISLEILLNEP